MIRRRAWRRTEYGHLDVASPNYAFWGTRVGVAFMLAHAPLLWKEARPGIDEELLFCMLNDDAWPSLVGVAA